MARFLLDANLSLKVGKFLTNELHLDVVTLHGLGLGKLKDHDVIRLARQQRRAIITLDRDVAEYFYRTHNPNCRFHYGQRGVALCSSSSWL